MTDTGVTLLTVTRDELIDLALDTLERADIDPARVIFSDILGVALTAEYVSADWGGDEEYWEELGFHEKCGCLIGTLRLERDENPNPGHDEELHHIGTTFYSILKEAYGVPYTDGSDPTWVELPDNLILHVLDEPS